MWKGKKRKKRKKDVGKLFAICNTFPRWWFFFVIVQDYIYLHIYVCRHKSLICELIVDKLNPFFFSFPKNTITPACNSICSGDDFFI